MPKPFYADYVNHILRFYFRWDNSKTFRNEVDEQNYKAADEIVRTLQTSEREILTTIYKSDSINVAENVVIATSIHKRDVSEIWSLLSTITSKIAKERRLI